MNPIIKAYTLAEITKGIADEIKFAGLGTWTEAVGTMKFLYHDLGVDLKQQDQAKWKSSVITFGSKHSSYFPKTDISRFS